MGLQLQISGEKTVRISEDFVGIFFEDINYGADGGIYAEMIENRSFEFLDARGVKDAYYQSYDGLYGWESIKGAHLSIRTQDPYSIVNPHYLHVVASAGAGFMNKAYDGIYLQKDKAYHLTFFARCENSVELSLAAVTADGRMIELDDLTYIAKMSAWKKYEVTFFAPKTIERAKLAFLFTNGGEADFDFISLFPADAVCGLFRKDLAELLKELQPSFMRFPGGCVVEGNDLANRYQWKQTIGEPARRKSNWNRWAVHNNNEENGDVSVFKNYNQTLGLGYYEYFVLCEYLGAKPIPVANVGIACQYQSRQLYKRTDPEYPQFIQDVLDLIEFANGDENTLWGGKRAQMGHPVPFGLEYIGIGNEQWQTEEVDFFERYADFEKAIHAVYPDIKLIGSAGPNVHTDTYDAAWQHYKGAIKDNTNYTFAVDEHSYMSPEWFVANTHFYDGYDCDVKVFIGEYAAHENDIQDVTRKNNVKCAVAEAAFLTGVERNADVVVVTSYAPLFARIGYTQWSPDLIWFDDKTSYGTPSYYVQKLFSTYTGGNVVASCLEGGEKEGIFHVVSEDEAHTYIKLVNTSENEVCVETGFSGYITRICLTGDWYEVNSIAEPKKVYPTEETVDADKLILKPYSVNVFVVDK